MIDNIIQKFHEILKHDRLAVLIIFLLTALVFGNIFRNEFVMDDYDFIVDWPLIQDLRNAPQFFVNYQPLPRQEGIYSPLKTLFHAINYNFFGLKPMGYHLLSLLIHFLGIYFVYRITKQLTQNNTIAFFTGLFFAVHPAHVEAITYMTASIDSLGVVFAFMAFSFYVQFRRATDNPRRWYGLSLLMALLAIFTHELTIALPLLLLLYDGCFSRTKVSVRKIWLSVLPFLIIVVSYALIKFLVLGAITRGGYVADSPYLTFLIAIKALAKYVIFVFFPLVLTHNHVIVKGISSFDPDDFDRYAVLSQSIVEPQTLCSLIFLLCIAYIATRQLEKNPVITFAMGWFFICLLPGANIIPSGVYFAERYLYFASFGFHLLLGIVFYNGMTANKRWIKTATGIICISLVSFYGMRSHLRNQQWQNEIALYESAVAANPQSALMLTDLGVVYTNHEKPEQALIVFKKAAAIKPTDPVIYFSMAEGFMQLQQPQMAVGALYRAIELDPSFADAYYNLAGIYASFGFNELAKQHLVQALDYFSRQGRGEDADRLESAFYTYFPALSDVNWPELMKDLPSDGQ